jgi:hypothetical protein
MHDVRKSDETITEYPARKKKCDKLIGAWREWRESTAVGG